MTTLQIIGLVVASLGGALTAFMRQYKIGPWNPENMTPPKDFTDLPYLPSTDGPATAPVASTATPLLWDTPQHAYHSTRVMCDNAGLTYDQKNEVCATIMGESEFNNNAKNINKRPDGSVGSTDWGICQINDRFHIGPNLDFPSVQYVLANPDKAVGFMIRMYKAGQIDMWCAHKNGWYKHFLLPGSKMWTLSTPS